MAKLSWIDDLINKNVEISDEDMLIKKGLLEGNTLNESFYNFNDKYYTLYKNYKVLLDKFLVDKFSLKEYDDRVANSELRFLPVKTEDMDYYQYMSSNMGLKYFYLRNNIYIEKLSNEDIEILVNLTENNLTNPSKEIMDIIGRTYEMVIDYCSGKGMPGKSLYGLDYPKNWHDSSELVFGFIHDDFADNGLDDDSWLDNNYKQAQFVNNLLEEMTKKSSQIMGKNVNYSWYNQYTIRESVMSK